MTDDDRLLPVLSAGYTYFALGERALAVELSPADDGRWFAAIYAAKWNRVARLNADEAMDEAGLERLLRVFNFERFGDWKSRLIDDSPIYFLGCGVTIAS